MSGRQKDEVFTAFTRHGPALAFQSFRMAIPILNSRFVSVKLYHCTENALRQFQASFSLKCPLHKLRLSKTSFEDLQPFFFTFFLVCFSVVPVKISIAMFLLRCSHLDWCIWLLLSLFRSLSISSREVLCSVHLISMEVRTAVFVSCPDHFLTCGLLSVPPMNLLWFSVGYFPCKRRTRQANKFFVYLPTNGSVVYFIRRDSRVLWKVTYSPFEFVVFFLRHTGCRGQLHV